MGFRNVVEEDKRFRDEPRKPVYRRWLCDADCPGEMISAGQGMSNAIGTSWLHRCDKCHRESWADATYPRISHIPL